jgi:hypothetical protein
MQKKLATLYITLKRAIQETKFRTPSNETKIYKNETILKNDKEIQ